MFYYAVYLSRAEPWQLELSACLPKRHVRAHPTLTTQQPLHAQQEATCEPPVRYTTML
jgi:hypothetical protein